MALGSPYLSERVADYVEGFVVEPLPVLARIREEMRQIGKPQHISPAQAQCLLVLAQAAGARSILECGTFHGYSAIWLAHALGPEGEILTIERDAERACRAREHIREVDFEDRVSVQVGEAQELVSQLAVSSFDLVFLDAEKSQYSALLRESIPLLRDGGLLVADNTLYRGLVVDEDPQHRNAGHMRRFNDELMRCNEVEATILPIGDGLTVAVKRT